MVHASPRCPLCQGNIQVDLTLLFGNAVCPKCDTLLWYIQFPPEQIQLFEHEPLELKARIKKRIAETLGVRPETLEEGSLHLDTLDSIDTVELVMELEEFR